MNVLFERITKLLFVLLILTLAISCKKKSNPYDVTNPAMPPDNVSNPARVELGKVLFFDPRLSGSNWISCASWRNPALGWGDGLSTGIGHNFQVLGRNSPAIVNLAFSLLQFWDGRVGSLEEQATRPIESTVEMNQNLDELVKELGAISESAKNGFGLFIGKAQCEVCHSGFKFSDNGFHNIGVKSLRGKEDIGRYAIVLVTVMKGAFKTLILIISYLLLAGLNAKEHTIDQKDKQFNRKDIVIKVGDIINFRNDDPFFHNMYSLSPIKIFDLGSYPKGQSKAVTFDKPGAIEVNCVIHPGMKLKVKVEK
jgi:cytochrome c peroxidase